MSLTSCIVIPARLASTRLPRKMLLADSGKPMVQHTYEAAAAATKADRVIVATDDEEILQCVESFGGEAIMTDPALASGTDRVAEIAQQLPEFDIFVNLQGDEPEMDGAAIDRVIELLEENPTAQMTTVAAPLRDIEQLSDPACVKVVFAANGKALYFSRSQIPFFRDSPNPPMDADPAKFHLHVGLYAYRRDFLLSFADLPPSMLEEAERLEQLRVLEAGHDIFVGSIPNATRGIDTPEDYASFVARFPQQRAA